MGTKGYFAIVYKGKVYFSYSQFDAYPQGPCGMGLTLVNDIRWGNIETWKWALDNIKQTSGTPTEEDKKALILYADPNPHFLDEWYRLTRKCQGSIAKTLKSGYFMGEIAPFDEKLLVTTLGTLEWGYAINLDKNEFRTFQGGKEIHFWRFPLDAIPLGTFSEVSMRAFNRIADGDELNYHDGGNNVVEAYKRFLGEEEVKLKEEEDDKKKAASLQYI